MKADYAVKFWKKVEKTDACWLWKAALHSAGYGVFRINCGDGSKGKLVYAHRFAYELLRGPIPEGLELDHLCRIRSCCNPAHLEPVTRKENWRRGLSPSVANASKSKCVNGHELSGENLYRRPDKGGRQCLMCKHEYFRGWYAKKKEKTAQPPRS